MYTLVIYDIPRTKVRNKIADVCKDYGLTRVQWSAFLGDLSQNRREELGQKLRKTLGKAAGDVQIYPICDKDLKLRTHIVSKGSGDKSDDNGERKAAKRWPRRSGGSAGNSKAQVRGRFEAEEESGGDFRGDFEEGEIEEEVVGDGTEGD